MQRGNIYRVGNCWMLRYRKPVLENGKEVMKLVSRKLATYSDVYHSLPDVQPLAAKILAPINAGQVRAESITPVVEFFEKQYLPSCEGRLHPATVAGYTQIWKVLATRAPDMALGDVRTVHIQRWLDAVAADKQRAHTQHRCMKGFLSAGFVFAIRNGAIEHNPVSAAKLPRGTPKQVRPAYTMDEFVGMLKVLGEPYRTIVLLAGLTGLRRAELQGLRWEDFSGAEMLVQRAVWNGQVSETKTVASNAAVPVVPYLAKALEEHKGRTSGEGYVFHNSKGGPVWLHDVAEKQIKPTLKDAGITWRGWHPFRYAVATILHMLDVDDKTIQLILRHSNIATTMSSYVKPPAPVRHAAMAKLEAALSTSSAEKIA